MRCAITAAVLTCLSASLSAGDWPAFRGPDGTGVSREKDVPTTWTAEKNVKWKAPLPGNGNSSPIVSAGRVFVTTASDEGHHRTLRCFDRTDGDELWSGTVEYEHPDPTHKANPYSGSTPAADGKRVVVWHGSAGLFCYRLDGKELWKCDLGEVRHIWGYGSSPVIHDGRVFLNVGPGKRTFMAAVALDSGKLLWKTDEPGGNSGEKQKGGWIGSWSTPLVVPVNGQTQILCSMPTRVVAYDPVDGHILWTVEGLANLPKGNVVYTSIVLGDDLGVAMGGYNGPAIGFEFGGHGDVTEANRLWRVTAKNPQRIGSGVIVDGHLYMANAGPGIVECLDPKTGEALWRDRLPGGNFWGSIVAADGLLFATNQQGTTHVFRANPKKLELVSSNPLGEPTNSTPAISDGEIFLRTTKHLYCVE